MIGRVNVGGSGKSKYRKMTAVIDLTNSNPLTSVTYADDAISMSKGSSGWDVFFGHYPCLLKNGVEVEKLDRNDFLKFDGKIKNFLNPTLSTTTQNGVTLTNNGDGTYTANGTANARTIFLIDVGRDIPKGTYKLLGSPSNIRNYTQDGLECAFNTEGIYHGIEDGNGIVFTLSETAKTYISIRFIAGDSLSNVVFKPMLTTDLGATYDDFVPYTDITSGNSGDVMIAFPRRGLSIKTVDNNVIISMTDNPNDPDYEYNAHTRGSQGRDVFYLGAYKGYVDSNNKLRSLSGKTITASKTISQFRAYAQANGSGYEQSAFYQLTYRQAMYILKYGNLDSQNAVGYGYVLSSHSDAIASGGTETWGMDSEVIKASNLSYMTDQNHHVKCFGLEDFWGNFWEWIDGLVTDSTRNVLTANSGFNDSGSGYANNGQGATGNIANYMSKPQGTTKTGFVAKEVSGSESTYFCDYAYLSASCVAGFGGHWSRGASAGAFLLHVTDASSVSYPFVAARLMYL